MVPLQILSWATCTVSTPCIISPPSLPPSKRIGTAKPARRWPCSRFPIQQAETNHYAIEVPLLGSLILTHDVNGVVPGLKDYAAPGPPTRRHSLFRLPHHGRGGPGDAGASCWWDCGCACADKLYDRDWFLRALMWASPLGFIAVVAGWTVTEVGRQPWTVYGVMRTAALGDALPDRLRCAAVAGGLYRGLCRSCFRPGCWLVRRIVRGGVSEPDEASRWARAVPSAPVKPVPGDAP